MNLTFIMFLITLLFNLIRASDLNFDNYDHSFDPQSYRNPGKTDYHLDLDSRIPYALMSDSFALLLYHHYRNEHDIELDTTQLLERLRIFKKFLGEVQVLQDQVEWKVGITFMAQMTEDEKELMTSGNVTDFLDSHKHGDAECNEYRQRPEEEVEGLQAFNAPKSFDWRAIGAVTPVKKQVKGAGSCWTFAAVTPMEGQMKALNRDMEVPDLSTQELTDCVYYGMGARYFSTGGHAHHAWDWIHKEGRIGYSAEIPLRHHGNFGGCSYGDWARNALDDYNVELTSIYFVPTERDRSTRRNLWMEVCLFSPVAVSINTKGSGLTKYKGGPFDPATSECVHNAPGNHAVVIVGYDPTYYYIKNSWGDKWGADGYIWWVRTMHSKDCSIFSWVNYPILKKKKKKKTKQLEQ